MAITLSNTTAPKRASTDPWIPGYTKANITAYSTIWNTVGFKYKVEIFRYNYFTNAWVSVAIIKQPPSPAYTSYTPDIDYGLGNCNIDVAPYIQAFLNEESFSDFSPAGSDTITMHYHLFGAVKCKVTFTEEVNGVTQGTPVTTQPFILYDGANSTTIPEDGDLDNLSWSAYLPTGQSNNACPWVDSSTVNYGLLTSNSENIPVSQSQPVPWTGSSPSTQGMPTCTMPRFKRAQYTMTVQAWSALQFSPGGSNPYVYPAWSVVCSYYNGSTFLGQYAQLFGYSAYSDPADNKQIGNTTDFNYKVQEAITTIKYNYGGFTNSSLESAATHVYVTTHNYRDPNICDGIVTPALDKYSSSSILAYSNMNYPITMHRINFEGSCEIPQASGSYTWAAALNETDRSKFGQIVFLNSYGGWDTIFLKQVKTEYTSKKTTWRKNQDAPSTVSRNGWKSVGVNSTDNTIKFVATTDFMQDVSEMMMRELYASPSAYLITSVLNDTTSANSVRNQYWLESYHVTISDSTFRVKRRQTDNLFQYTIECIADAKYRTQRS
jgi:hypothetical protein